VSLSILRGTLNSVAPTRRTRWLLLSLLLFLGIFAGSVTCRVAHGAHAPQRAAARAIGANASLASVARDESLPQLSMVSIAVVALLIRLCSPKSSCSGGSYTLPVTRNQQRPASVWLPPLLFRPPPVSTVA